LAASAWEVADPGSMKVKKSYEWSTRELLRVVHPKNAWSILISVFLDREKITVVTMIKAYKSFE
jgi:hypothetical protein